MKKTFFIALFLNLISINKIDAACNDGKAVDRHGGSCNDDYECGIGRQCVSGVCQNCP